MLPVDRILECTGACSFRPGEWVQSLWSGYGEIRRGVLDGESVIVKHVSPPGSGSHPRGWNTNRSHERKLRSYRVEAAWYRSWSNRCGSGCRVPRSLCVEDLGEAGMLFVLEDLDAAGFPLRVSRPAQPGISACLAWLAEFHACFLGEEPAGLWPTGTYWHLATRPDEHAAMPAGPLKDQAGELDAALAATRYPTFVHGDAKVANFCFSPDESAVAVVDFQYTGGGCGMKDVAYFLGSIFDERECEQRVDGALYLYFRHFRAALSRQGRLVDASAIETEWRALFPVAWTDFYRFLAGWSPGHPKMNPYSERLAGSVLDGWVLEQLRKT